MEDSELFVEDLQLIECPKCNYLLLDPTIYPDTSSFSPKLDTHEILFHSGEDVNFLCQCYMCDYVWIIDTLTHEDPPDFEGEGELR